VRRAGVRSRLRRGSRDKRGKAIKNNYLFAMCHDIQSKKENEVNRLILEAELKNAVQNATFIKNGSEKSCEGIKYDFVLSDHIISQDLKRPINLNEHKESKATIKPGEIAFVMSKESLALPDDMFCQLSAKRKLSLDGIIILGGLIIDPNYKGRLIFGLYNISSIEYPLIPGRKLIAGVFFKIEGENACLTAPDSIENFPDELIKMVSTYKPTTIDGLHASVEELKDEIRDLKNKLANDDSWKESFRNGLNELKELVMKVGENLNNEISARKDDVQKLNVQYSGFNTIKKFLWVALGLLGLGFIAVVSFLFNHWRQILEILLENT
jgi:deoxycytidine triphosphate deaminase